MRRRVDRAAGRPEEVRGDARRRRSDVSPADALRARAARVVARPFFALAILLGRVTPPRLLLPLGDLASRSVFRLFPGVRRNLLDNARHVLGESSTPAQRAHLAREVLASFSRFILEWVSPGVGGGTEGLFERMHGREHFEAALAAGKGALVVTLHMGNYELPARELAALRRDVAIVFNRERIGFLERIRSRSRRGKQLDEIALDASPFVALDIAARLRRGGVVLLAGDQPAPPDGEAFRFLHGTARFSLWAARLSLQSGAPLLPAVCVRTDGGAHQLRIEAPIRPDPRRDAREMTEELVRTLEGFIRREPGQWLMVHRFWEP